jgi:methyl-accepting chemotaxis protein
LYVIVSFIIALKTHPPIFSQSFFQSKGFPWHKNIISFHTGKVNGQNAVKNHRLYSDKFTLSVLDLTQINLATEEDKAYHIDRWARLFKAKTWEELKMIAAKDDALLDASKTLYSLNGDETIRAQCRAREDYDRLHNAINRTIEQLTADKEQLTADKEQLTADKEQLTADKEQLTADKEQLTSRVDILASENSTLTSENNTLVSENDTLRKLLQEHGIPYPTSED